MGGEELETLVEIMGIWGVLMDRLHSLQLQSDMSLHSLGQEWGCMGHRVSSEDHKAPQQVIMAFY